MHVLFDARLVHRATSGLERVQVNLLRELAGRREVTRLRALVRPGVDLSAHVPARVEPEEVRSSEEILALLVGDDAPDVLHFTFFPDRDPHDLLLVGAARASVVSVTDAILNRHPEYHRTEEEHAWYDRFVRALVAGADRVLSYTASAGREAVEETGADPTRVDLASLAVDPRLEAPLGSDDVRARLERLGIDGDWFVLVGKDYPHKDHATALRALARLGGDTRIVCAGQKVYAARDGDESTDALLSRLALTDRVRWIEGLDDDDVKAVLQGSKGLLYPSLEEGFGLPPLEAMRLGVPVCAARAMSIPEVCGDGALLFEPGDDEALAAAMRTFLAGGDEVAALVRRGRARAAEFTWERAADGVVASYREAVDAGAARSDDDVRVTKEMLAVIAACPFHGSAATELEAWRDRCRHVEDHLRNVTAHRDELAERCRRLEDTGRPRWSLSRRLKKIRDRFGG